MQHMALDTGNTGFMLLCCSLVMLMTPGLAFFYGGLVGRRHGFDDARRPTPHGPVPQVDAGISCQREDPRPQ